MLKGFFNLLNDKLRTQFMLNITWWSYGTWYTLDPRNDRFYWKIVLLGFSCSSGLSSLTATPTWMKLVQTGGSRKPRKVAINLALGTWTLDIMTSAARANVLRLLHTQMKILSNYNFVPKHMRELVHIKIILISSKQAKATTVWKFMFASVDLLTNICLKICLRTLALLFEIIFIVGTSPIVCDVGSTVSALRAAVLDQQVCLSQIKRVKGELGLVGPDRGPTLKSLTNLTVGISKTVERKVI